jgi:hypothetical protein
MILIVDHFSTYNTALRLQKPKGNVPTAFRAGKYLILDKSKSDRHNIESISYNGLKSKGLFELRSMLHRMELPTSSRRPKL